MRAWIVGLTLIGLQAPASAVTLGEFAGALAVPTTAKHSANNWDALEADQRSEVARCDSEGSPQRVRAAGRRRAQWPRVGSVLVVGARQMMFDTEVSLRRLLEKKGLAQTLKAQFSAATLIEQIGGECRTKAGSGSARLYRVTLPAKRPLFMWLEFQAQAMPAHPGRCSRYRSRTSPMGVLKTEPVRRLQWLDA